MKYPILLLNKEQELEVKRFNQNEKISLEAINCIICKSSNYKILYTNDRYGINQQTVMCNNCGFIYPQVDDAFFTPAKSFLLTEVILWF